MIAAGSPSSPLSPLSPFAPLRFLKANAKVLAVLVPPGVTVTLGVPTLASTVAVTVPNPAAAPVAPCGPCSP